MEAQIAVKQDTKTTLIKTGMDLMLQKGYSNTGIQEVLTASNVPKGSFYHYFDSKEQFAVAIIRYFDQICSEDLQQILSNRERSPIERLRDYCEYSKANLVAQECSKGCLIGNLSQEMSDQSEVLRKELSFVMNKRRDTLAACIEEAQRLKEIRSSTSAHKLAEFFSAAWGGAVMMAKTVKNSESLDVFIELMFNNVLI
jgi:TetR/AcrR family transcriptional repressor of nem operon